MLVLELEPADDDFPDLVALVPPFFPDLLLLLLLFTEGAAEVAESVGESTTGYDIMKNIRYDMLVRYRRMRMWSHGGSGTHEQLTLLVMRLTVGATEAAESVGESTTGYDIIKNIRYWYACEIDIDVCECGRMVLQTNNLHF